MKRTTITMDGCGRVSVPSDAANVWMSEMELVTLFDVIAPPPVPPSSKRCSHAVTSVGRRKASCLQTRAWLIQIYANFLDADDAD